MVNNSEATSIISEDIISPSRVLHDTKEHKVNMQLQATSNIAEMMTDMNQLSNIIDKLDVTHEKRKSAMNNYARNSIIQMIDENTNDLNQMFNIHGRVSTETQTDVSMLSLDESLKAKREECLDLIMQLRILQADYNEIQYQNQKQKNIIKKQEQKISE